MRWLRRSREGADRIVVYVNAPFSGTPYIGETIAHGAELAAASVNDPGPVDRGAALRLDIVRADTGLSPRSAVVNVRRAVEEGAVAIVDEGTGVDASWTIARDADLPLGVVYQGGKTSSTPSTARTSSGSRRPTTGSRTDWRST